MTWAKLDDSVDLHPKFLELSFAARGVWMTALAWSSRSLTEGRLPRKLAASLEFPADIVQELVDRGLWDVTAEGWQVHNYTDYNPTKAEVMTVRAKGKVRAAKHYAAKRGARRWDSSPEESAQKGAKNTCVLHVPVPVPVNSSLSSTNLLNSESSSHFEPTHRERAREGSNGSEFVGYRWLESTLGTTPPDLFSWRDDYAKIGAKPEAERLAVARHLLKTPYIASKRSKATPGHLVKFWAQFVEGPRDVEMKPTFAKRGFQGIPQVASAEEFARDAVNDGAAW